MDNWQPIETVPRDGTPIIVLGRGGERGVGVLRLEDFNGLTVTSNYFAFAHRRDGDAKAAVYMPSAGLEYLTHWMPLPNPPRVKE